MLVLLLLLGLLAGALATNAAAANYTGTVFSGDELTDGDYIIVDHYSSSYDYYALGNFTAGSSGNGYGFAGVGVTVSDNTATVSNDAAIWTWNSSTKSFYNAASGKYLNLPSSTYSPGNFFSSSPVALTFYTVSGNEATVYVPSGTGGYYLNAAYPSGGKAFNASYARYINNNYLKSGNGVFFYKIESSAPVLQDSSIALDQTSVSIDLATGTTAAVTATPTGCTLSGVSSSDASVATASVSGSVITVTGVAAGTATITVSGTANNGYNAPADVTFTVTVTAPGGENPGGDDPYSGGSDAGGGMEVSKEVSVSDVDADTAFDLTMSAYATAAEHTSTVVTGGSANIVMVIDISGSIVGKEEALNSAIQGVVNDLPEGSQVGVVTFNESASMSQVYTPATISGLSFYGVDGKGTNMATGIAAATSLLNGSGWQNAENDKAMIIISDFDADDYADSINNAKTAKSSGISVYAVAIDKEDPAQTADRTELSTDSRATSVAAFIPYVSGNYPNASAVNSSMFGMFNQATVTPGGGATSGYVYGAAGGNWSEIFSSITSEVIGYESVRLDATAVLRDQVHVEKFDLTDAVATAKIYDYNNGTWSQVGAATDSLSSWTNKSGNDGTLTVSMDKSSGVVTVTGFSYQDHYLPDSGTEAAGVPAQKVELVISGVKLRADAQTTLVQVVPTNIEDASGIFEADGTTAIRFPVPTVRIAAKDDSSGSVTLHKTAAPVSGTTDQFDVTLAVDVTETTTIQSLVTSYMDAAIANDLFYNVPSGNANGVKGTIVHQLPGNAKPVTGTGDKSYTFRFKDTEGNTVAVYVLRVSPNNCGFLLKLSENQYLVMNDGKLNSGYEGDIQFADVTVQDAFYAAITSTETSTSSSSSLPVLNSVSDQMGDYIIYKDSAAPDGGTVTPTAAADMAGTTITWKPAKGSQSVKGTPDTAVDGDVTTLTVTYTNYAVLTYRVQVDTTKAGFVYGTDYPANDHATLTYTLDGTQRTADFPIPTVNVPVPAPASKTVVVDFNMKYLLAEGVSVQPADPANGTLLLEDGKLYFTPKADDYTSLSASAVVTVQHTNGASTVVTILPADSIYYDDSLKELTASQNAVQGYDASVPTGSTTIPKNENGRLTFRFTGTRCDIYCTTNANTGWVMMKYYAIDKETNERAETPMKAVVMNNKYAGSGSLYNVPTLTTGTLDYGTYEIELQTAARQNYALDGIRVYNPGNNDAVFTQVRDLILAGVDLNKSENGVLFIDTNGAVKPDQWSTEYKDKGPKNEVYLSGGQLIAFRIADYDAGTMQIEIGVSAPEAGSGSFSVNGGAKQPVNSVTDMYYAIEPPASAQRNGIVVLKNEGTSLLSITNIKITDKSGAVPERLSLSYDPDMLDFIERVNSGVKTVWSDSASAQTALLRQLWKVLLQSLNTLFDGLPQW